jgi:hypothetical protein
VLCPHLRNINAAKTPSSSNRAVVVLFERRGAG